MKNYSCDICSIALTPTYRDSEIWPHASREPIGVGLNKYVGGRYEGCYVLIGKDYLRELNLAECDLCQNCFNKCLAVIEDETTQIADLTYRRREKLNAYLAKNLRQFNQGVKE